MGTQFALAAGLDESLDRLKADANFVDISSIQDVAVDLRYSSRNNFTGTNLYGPFNRAFLHQLAAQRLRVAAGNLQKLKPGFKLLVLDATRPRSVQRILWAHVRATDLKAYVSNPAKGSIHNFGFAVDITLIDANGREIDMGTPFDSFDELSQPALEDQFLREGRLSSGQVSHRRLLRAAMQQAGFRQLQSEWWHYDALPAAFVRGNYSILE